MIILPRQARDKHRESSKKGGVFLQWKDNQGQKQPDIPDAVKVRENVLFTANCIIIDLFTAFESGLVAPFLDAA